MRWAKQWGASKYNLQLILLHGCAIDYKIAFVYGALVTPAATIRSVLLRTEDAGVSWREVMEPELGSAAIDIVLLNKRIGWALVQWETESPGEANLFRTTNSGETWKRISDIPKPGLAEVRNLHFKNEAYGTIEITYDDPNHSFWILSTLDGGKSWIETKRLTHSEYIQAFGKEPDSEIASHGCDDGLWQIKGKNDRLFVYRRNNKKQDWKIFSELWKTYRFVNGQLIPNEVR